jgi:hypothetical protein
MDNTSLQEDLINFRYKKADSLARRYSPVLSQKLINFYIEKKLKPRLMDNAEAIINLVREKISPDADKLASDYIFSFSVGSLREHTIFSNTDNDRFNFTGEEIVKTFCANKASVKGAITVFKHITRQLLKKKEDLSCLFSQ